MILDVIKDLLVRITRENMARVNLKALLEKKIGGEGREHGRGS